MSPADFREADSTEFCSCLDTGEVSNLGRWGMVKLWKGSEHRNTGRQAGQNGSRRSWDRLGTQCIGVPRSQSCAVGSGTYPLSCVLTPFGHSAVQPSLIKHCCVPCPRQCYTSIISFHLLQPHPVGLSAPCWHMRKLWLRKLNFPKARELFEPCSPCYSSP